MSGFTGIKWVFFDVGDTLLDEREMLADWSRQMSAGLAQRFIARTWQQIMTARERAYAAMSPIVLKEMGNILGVVPEVWADCWNRAALNHTLEPPFPGTTEALTGIAARYKLGLIANQDLGTQDRMCSHGWGKLFDVCISSTEEGVRKPDPAIFKLALRRANCAATEAVMIGDRIDNDIRPAKALGMKTIRIAQGASRLQAPRDDGDRADFTVGSVGEIASLLLP